MNEFAAMPNIEVGEYQHYKGNRYRVLGVGRHTEQDEYFVVYIPLYDHKDQPDIWIRPYVMFMGTVTDKEGNEIPRFKKI